MAICCVVCGCWYPDDARDRLDICSDCYRQNFAGAQPPLDPCGPPAREALEAYVDSPHELTPRKVQALRQWQAHWQRLQAEDAP